MDVGIKAMKMKSIGEVGSWNERKRKLKLKFGYLTDTDLVWLVGRKEEMLGKLQLKLGKTREELLGIIAKL